MEQNASMILNRTFSPCNLFPTTFPIWKAHFWTGFGNNPPSLHSLLVDLTFPFYPKSYFIYLVALVVQMCCFFFLNLFTAVMQIPSRKLKVQGYLERAIWVIKWNLGNHWNTGLIRGWGGKSIPSAFKYGVLRCCAISVLKAMKTDKMHYYRGLLISILGPCNSRWFSKVGYSGGCR